VESDPQLGFNAVGTYTGVASANQADWVELSVFYKTYLVDLQSRRTVHEWFWWHSIKIDRNATPHVDKGGPSGVRLR
jgi:hypothetical protein